MKLLYTKTVEPVIKNKWIISVEWMHGDADAYTTEKYEFDNGEDFKKVAEFFQKLFDFRKKHHNLMCYICQNRAKEGWWERGNEDVLKDFFGECENLYEMFEKLSEEVGADIDAIGDSTADHQYIASPQKFKRLTHFDKDGIKFDITIE